MLWFAFLSLLAFSVAHCREDVSYGFIYPIDQATLCGCIDQARTMIYKHFNEFTEHARYSPVVDYILNVIYAPLYESTKSTSHPLFASKVEDLTTFITKGLTSDLMNKKCKDLSEQEMQRLIRTRNAWHS